MLVWILCYFFWPGTMALSEELAGPSLEWARSSIQSGLRELDRLASTLPRDPSCFPGQESSGLSCAEISDSFCRNLWDRNGGNQKIFDGRILLGTSPLSGISHAQMQDLQSLLASRTRLPEDLQERAADTLNKLENALKRETKGAAWKREVSDLLREFHRAEEDTEIGRAHV